MYEEYIQNLLGRQMMPSRDTYNPNCMQDTCYNELCDCNSYNPMQYNYMNRNENILDTEEIERFYPEIYKTIYPMVQEACMQNTKPVNEELIEELTGQIYANIETGDIININVTVGENRENKDNVSEDRQKGQRNRWVNDLIRILLIRELLKRRNRQSHMAPMPPVFGMPEFSHRLEMSKMHGALPRY